MTVRREAVPDSPDIRVRMREIAALCRRFGNRRISMMLPRECITINHRKLRRLYNEKGLAVKRRRGGRTREPVPVLDGPTKRWSVDFGSAVFGTARSCRMLNLIDDCAQERLSQADAWLANWTAAFGSMA